MKKSYVHFFFHLYRSNYFKKTLFCETFIFMIYFNTFSYFKNSPKKSISNMKILI